MMASTPPPTHPPMMAFLVVVESDEVFAAAFPTPAPAPAPTLAEAEGFELLVAVEAAAEDDSTETSS